MRPLGVGELTEQIKNLLESTFIQVSVEGELSRITYHNSGHIYFTLKDADASISGVMFRGNAASLKFRLEEGLKVIIHGGITLYKPSGKYQIRALGMEPSGHGALSFAFEQLKRELEAAGYFDLSRKKNLPKYPMKIALITSATGAALQDMLRVAQQRWPLLHVSLYDVLVQGESAAASIAAAIGKADAAGYDAIVIGRGGGSIEDLWAFNERIVADAIFAAVTPIVSAVGHEIDSVISDFVADLRAPTPSAAMQMILPDQNELLQGIDIMMGRFWAQMGHILSKHADALHYLLQSFQRHSIEQKMALHRDEICQLKARFVQQITLKLQEAQRTMSPVESSLAQLIRQRLDACATQVKQLERSMQGLNPELRSKRGYAQITQEGHIVALEALHVKDRIALMDAYRIVEAEVLNVETIQRRESEGK